MGDIKKQRKKYDTPRFPWRTDIMQAELKLIGEFGLRNKHELWRNETMLSTFRGTARSLIGKAPEERKKMEEEILARLKKLGVLPETAVLDDVLDLTIEDILERRLQTLVLRKGLAKTAQQARQLITHGHITIGGQRVKTPGHLVTKPEEAQIGYKAQSALANPNHPLRQTITVAPQAEPGPEREGDQA
ncbi:MAG TPA: 30S ribosomal protein S4 [Candidatus Eisenbacteria bacterium]|nr:30S ribosomal protein S4 [Candidatus Eisenbacteria bacterium]